MVISFLASWNSLLNEKCLTLFYLTHSTHKISSFHLFLILTPKKNHWIFIFLPTNCKNMFQERSAKLQIKYPWPYWQRLPEIHFSIQISTIQLSILFNSLATKPSHIWAVFDCLGMHGKLILLPRPHTNKAISLTSHAK